MNLQKTPEIYPTSEADSAYTESTSEDEDERHILQESAITKRSSVSIHASCEGSIASALQATLSFWAAVIYFAFGGRYESSPFFKDSPQARAQVYSLVMVLWMWDRPHYRTGSYQDDMRTNLRNVAIPGTGVPLSWLVSSKLLAALFLLWGYPLVALVAGCRKGGFDAQASLGAYVEQLLRPQDWFSFWRLNCVCASYHAVVTE